jgi:uncharacterized protein with HEPN domain
MERLQNVMDGVTLGGYSDDWQRQWVVERGLEIISKTIRNLPDDLKDPHPGIPWPKVAGVGNVLRHNCEGIAAPVMWALVRDDLPPLNEVCREELARAQAGGA